MVNREKDGYFLQSLANGLHALQIFANSGPSLTVSELASALGTTKTTATRICLTLGAQGFLRRNGDKRYALTLEVLSLGYSALCSLDWREIAQYYLDALFSEIHKNVNLSVLDGGEVLHIIRIKKKDLFPFVIRVGTRLPAHCTAMGKVLLAMGKPEIVAPIIENLKLHPLTSRSIRDLNRFRHELSKTQSRGFAVNYEEVSMGICSVAAPVLDRNNHAVAAISIVATTSEHSQRELERVFAPKVISVARQISKALSKVESSIVMDSAK